MTRGAARHYRWQCFVPGPRTSSTQRWSHADDRLHDGNMQWCPEATTEAPARPRPSGASRTTVADLPDLAAPSRCRRPDHLFVWGRTCRRLTFPTAASQQNDINVMAIMAAPVMAFCSSTPACPHRVAGTGGRRRGRPADPRNTRIRRPGSGVTSAICWPVRFAPWSSWSRPGGRRRGNTPIWRPGGTPLQVQVIATVRSPTATPSSAASRPPAWCVPSAKRPVQRDLAGRDPTGSGPTSSG